MSLYSAMKNFPLQPMFTQPGPYMPEDHLSVNTQKFIKGNEVICQSVFSAIKALQIVSPAKCYPILAKSLNVLYLADALQDKDYKFAAILIGNLALRIWFPTIAICVDAIDVLALKIKEHTIEELGALNYVESVACLGLCFTKSRIATITALSLTIITAMNKVHTEGLKLKEDSETNSQIISFLKIFTDGLWVACRSAQLASLLRR